MDRWTRWLSVAFALLALFFAEIGVVEPSSWAPFGLNIAIALTALAILNRWLWARSQALRRDADRATASPLNHRLALLEHEVVAARKERHQLQEMLRWQEHLLTETSAERSALKGPPAYTR